MSTLPASDGGVSFRFWMLALFACAMAAGGCAKFARSEMDALGGDAKASNLTTGMVKLKIEKGQTSQATVLEVFGPPDQVTHRGDLQIWTYDKISYQTRIDAGSLAFYEASSRVSQSVSTMLIVYFGPDDVVRDYRLDSYRF